MCTPNTEGCTILLRVLSLLGGFHWLTGTVIRNQTTAMPSMIERVCSSSTCRHGQCYVVGNRPRCACDPIYQGDRCQLVNLDSIKYAIVGRVVFFHWQTPPRLKGYAILYYPNETPDVISIKPIHMSDRELSLVVGDLKGARTRYTMCIEDQYKAESVMVSRLINTLHNCLEICTEHDYHTMVAWVIACALFCVIVFLVYHQKEKIELIFFHKPPIPWRKSSKDGTELDPFRLPSNGNGLFSIKEQDT